MKNYIKAGQSVLTAGKSYKVVDDAMGEWYGKIGKARYSSTGESVAESGFPVVLEFDDLEDNGFHMYELEEVK